MVTTRPQADTMADATATIGTGIRTTVDRV